MTTKNILNLYIYGRFPPPHVFLQMAEIEAVRKLESERREKLSLQRDVLNLQVEIDNKHKAMVEQSQGLCFTVS